MEYNVRYINEARYNKREYFFHVEGVCMKLFIQSVIFSIVVHVIYLGGSLLYGWYVTSSYVPSIANDYDEVTYLQHEVAFGFVIHPIYYFISFVLTVFIGVILIYCMKKFRVFQRRV